MRKPPIKAYGYEDCRDLRHAWERQSDEVLYSRNADHLFTRTVICTRCETQRIDTYRVPSKGQKIMVRMGSKYRYPKEYVVKGGYDVDALRWRMFKSTDLRVVG